MTEEAIQVGDVVALRTGGPTMLVRARSQDLAYCAWRSESGSHSGTFDVGSLQLATEPARSHGGDGAEAGLAGSS